MELKDFDSDKPATFVVEVIATKVIALPTLVAAEVGKYQGSHDLISATLSSGATQHSQRWILLFSNSAREIAERLDHIEKKLDSIEHLVNRNFV